MSPSSRSRTKFWAILAAAVFIHAIYGLKRLTLGIDFTDEGAYLAWPMRMLFGERLFEADPLTLLRPLQSLLFVIFKFAPGITLYEFRLIGWALHLGSFAILSYYLFRLCHSAWQSVLIASIPFFICHIFGLASPSYNSLSSDLLLVALSLRALSFLDNPNGSIPLNMGSGLALFVATVAHPGLGVIAAIILIHEAWRHRLMINILRRRPTGPNIGVIVFILCWLVFLLFVTNSGALSLWIERTKMFQSFAVTAKEARPGLDYWRLIAFPFSYSRLALVFTFCTLALVAALHLSPRLGGGSNAERTRVFLAFLLLISLLCSFSYEAEYLPISFALVSMLLIGIHWVNPTRAATPADSEIRYLLLISGAAAGCYAALTFYFHPYRSWISGILGLPFAFSVGLSLLLRVKPDRWDAIRMLAVGSLILVVGGAAGEHYRNIQRDDSPARLDTHFSIPKLKHIKSTAERAHAINELYAYLRPKLTRGEPFLAYDDCPMLYFLFDAKPSYGLTWASRYAQRPATLQQLNRELQTKPLPRFAIRTIVNLSSPVWSTAPRTNYEQYPLNETVMSNYVLDRIIFPFEIWRLKMATPQPK